jgi:hypothetical protein
MTLPSSNIWLGSHSVEPGEFPECEWYPQIYIFRHMVRGVTQTWSHYTRYIFCSSVHESHIGADEGPQGDSCLVECGWPQVMWSQLFRGILKKWGHHDEKFYAPRTVGGGGSLLSFLYAWSSSRAMIFVYSVVLIITVALLLSASKAVRSTLPCSAWGDYFQPCLGCSSVPRTQEF